MARNILVKTWMPQVATRGVSATAVTLMPRQVRTTQRQSKPAVSNDEMDGDDVHVPVMKDEVVEALSPQEGQVLIDMTFGAGGHTRALLHQAPTARVFALDRDPAANDLAKQMAEKYRGRLHPLLGRFSQLDSLLQGEGLGHNSVDGILIDAGCSSLQFDTAERGFAISKDGPLDMRMDGTRFPSQPTAADVVNTLDAESLTKIFSTYGEESNARKIASAIVEYRRRYTSIATTGELATIVSCAFTHTQSRQRRDKMGRSAHVATKTFQGLRIFVNDELNELSVGLETAGRYLRPGGRLAALSFHSLEDRIVKRFLQGREVFEKGRSLRQQRREHSAAVPEEVDSEVRSWEPSNRNKATVPSEEEIKRNPRSRSAKLRVAIKL